jgi:NADH:ubiquinone oxidoreductase subunit 3 (subunit A)
MNPLLMLFIFVPILVGILLLVNFFIGSSTNYPDQAKNQAYECGFSPDFAPTNNLFSIHHFSTALCFLVFDLEITAFLPLTVSMFQVSFFGTSFAILFFILLTLGFILEITQSVIRLTDLTGRNQTIENRKFV